jgi:hypothetical protein
VRAIAEPESGIAGRRQTRACRQRRVERLLSRHLPADLRALAPDVRAGIDALLAVPESAAVSGFEGLKADPGKAGVDAFMQDPDSWLKKVQEAAKNPQAPAKSQR